MIDVAIILFNKKGLVTFVWCKIIHFYYYFFVYLFIVIIIIIIILLALPLLKQPSIQRCISRCKLCDRLGNANFKTKDPRRPWCTMVLSNIHGDVRVSISPGRLVRRPRRSDGCT